MLELAIEAHIPVVSITSDDPVNLERSLQLIAGRKPAPYNKLTKQLGPYIYFTYDSALVTNEAYVAFEKNENTLVIINPEDPNDLVLDCGDLPVPPKLLKELLVEYFEESDMDAVRQVLKGLSLKKCSQIIRLTLARTKGSTAPSELRRTRASMGETIQGLIPVEPSVDFYEFPEKLKAWLLLNEQFFKSAKTPAKLVPRGVMLEGSPGVGKSMAAKAIAKFMSLPMYRLDIAQILGRYVGESETRVARALALLEREAPCVLLLDELDKVFTQSNDEGVTTRILSQLLWWLAEHKCRIITVMTSNDLSKIPPELYRAGRMDMVMKIPRMSLAEAKQFAQLVFNSVMNKKPHTNQVKELIDTLRATDQDDFSHSEVAEHVYGDIKRHGWLTT